MKHSRLVTTGLLTVALFTAGPAFAAVTNTLPPEQTHGVVTYRSGGIGREEARAFAAAATQYPLSLAFVITHSPRAAFTSDVHVTIANAQGKSVLDTRSDGPFLLANLPAGRYTVTAAQHGRTLHQTVHVATHKSAHLLFQWAA
jgi:hypothetical protein